MASAIAIITRWRWPPESSCGNEASRCSGSGMPTRASSSSVRARAASAVIWLWSSSTSLICFSTRCSGFSDVIGSWKIIAMRSPRIFASRSSGAPTSSSPSKRMRPDGWRAAGYGSSCRIESAVTDLPEPLSPTSATVSPRSISNETPRTASTTRPPRVEVHGEIVDRRAARSRRLSRARRSSLPAAGRRRRCCADRRRRARLRRRRSAATACRAITTKPESPSHGAVRLFLPWFRISPSDGEPAGRPKPRKSSAVSDVIAPDRMNGRNESAAVIAFGRMWRAMIARSRAPSARAART